MPHPLSHGVQMFFWELAANRRRVAGTLLAVSVTFAGVIWLAGRPWATDVLHESVRFGFEGPEEWLERVRLAQMAARESPGLFAITQVVIERRKTGKKLPDRSTHPQAEPTPRTSPEGDDADDLLARARQLALEGPIVRSEDMIIERLVNPEYPEEAHARNLEGVVEMVALVDTSGAVLEVQIIGGSREPLFETAAAKAILERRYRPYRVADQNRRVWAAFRIGFTLY